MFRISTNSFYSRSTSQMAALSQNADKLQTQIATGKKLSGPSDDAVTYQRLAQLRRNELDDATYAGNVAMAQGVVAAADTTLETIQQQLQRAAELAIQANSGSRSPEDLQVIATALDGMLEDLVALANTRDVRGQPIFGAGGDGAFERAADGTVSYVGGVSTGGVPIGESASVQLSDNGARIFGGDGDPVVTDMFATVAALAAALRDGTDVAGGVEDALEGLEAAQTQVTTARSVVGARGARLDFETQRLEDVALDRDETRVAIESTDIGTAIAELQKTLTILNATQASFTKLSGLSLFDYLR